MLRSEERSEVGGVGFVHSQREVPGVEVVCGRCGYTTNSFGVGESSIRRCLVLLREGCRRGERNYYEEGAAADFGEEEPPGGVPARGS